MSPKKILKYVEASLLQLADSGTGIFGCHWRCRSSWAATSTGLHGNAKRVLIDISPVTQPTKKKTSNATGMDSVDVSNSSSSTAASKPPPSKASSSNSKTPSSKTHVSNLKVLLTSLVAPNELPI